MTKSEYLQILEKSPSFKKLDQLTQEQMRNAEGAEMESTAKAFLEEAEIIAKAYANLAEKTEEVVAEVKQDGQKNKKAKLFKAEIKLHSTELNSVENLLKNL